MSAGITVAFHYSSVMNLQPGRPQLWVCPPLLVLMRTLRGRGTLLVQDADAHPVDDKTHSLYLMTPDIKRHVLSDPAAPLVVHATGFTFEYADGRDFFARWCAQTLSPTSDDCVKFVQQMCEIDQLQTVETTAARRQIDLLSLAICGLATRYLTTREVKIPDSDRCRNAVDYINLHYREDDSMDDLAARCNMSRTLFFRVFHEETGMTPGEYRMRRRLREAQKMLLRPELSVGEISVALGWENPFYFSRIFKRETGLAPSDFRCRHLGQD